MQIMLFFYFKKYSNFTMSLSKSKSRDAEIQDNLIVKKCNIYKKPGKEAMRIKRMLIDEKKCCAVCSSSLKLVLDCYKPCKEPICLPCQGFLREFFRSPRHLSCTKGECFVILTIPCYKRLYRCLACWLNKMIISLTVRSGIKIIFEKYPPRIDGPVVVEPEWFEEETMLNKFTRREKIENVVPPQKQETLDYDYLYLLELEQRTENAVIFYQLAKKEVSSCAVDAAKYSYKLEVKETVKALRMEVSSLKRNIAVRREMEKYLFT